MVSEPLGFDGIKKMAKKGGEMSTSSEHRVEMVSPMLSLILLMTNYHIWEMRMDVFFVSHDMWHAIEGENMSKKKDRMAFSTVFGVVLEDVMTILDVKKMTKENWDILR